MPTAVAKVFGGSEYSESGLAGNILGYPAQLVSAPWRPPGAAD